MADVCKTCKNVSDACRTCKNVADVCRTCDKEFLTWRTFVRRVKDEQENRRTVGKVRNNFKKSSDGERINKYGSRRGGRV